MTSPSMAPTSGDFAGAVDLAALALFQGSSTDMLHWIQDNLEPRIFFSDS